PPFFTGILVSWEFGLIRRMFTPGDFPNLQPDFPRAVLHLFFGAVCLSIPRIAMTVRMMRATVISEMNKAYDRTAISRGNDRHSVLTRHVLKNAMVSVVPFLGQTLAELFGAGIVVEQVLGIPGLGRFLVTSISHRDYPVVQAIVVILAFWVVLAGTAADLIDQAIDPRLRTSGPSGQFGGAAG
ncbi:MAG: ABC transporter permease, partial [Oscillospiraceae bacterium]|nr:ABC transporter permease [Oscillospiraceae bacterium]